VTLEHVFAAEMPITHHLGIRVDEAGPNGVTLTLPLAPNRNAHGTMFAGSVNAAATLAAWGVVWLELGRLNRRGMVVVQDSRIEYRAPIAEDCRVVALRPDIRALERFATMLERRRRGRIDLTVMVQTGRILAAHFHGRYVALL
jgi:thioesterase domain-containing protein